MGVREKQLAFMPGVPIIFSPYYMKKEKETLNYVYINIYFISD